MGLRQRLTALSLRRVHVLLVEVPGWWPTRVAAQQELWARGWPEASSPADADVLLVCGRPGDRLDAAVGLVWEQLPGPRAMERAKDPADVAGALDRAVTALADTEQQRRDARDRDRPDQKAEQPEDDSGGQEDVPEGTHDMSGADHEDMDHEDMDHKDMDHGDMSGMDHGDMSGMDHGDMSGMDHGDMDHGDMDMAPDGIPLAGGGEDRDGLEMDVLQVPLGPVLPCWPAGLVLHCSLQGDVVVAAEVEVLPAGSAAPDADRSPRTVAARLCDQAGQVLELSGWGAAAQQAGQVRDELLAGDDLTDGRAALERLRARVGRSRVLRWSLRDLGRASAAGDGTGAPPAPPGGDVHDRLLSLLRSAGDHLLDDPDGTLGPSGWTGIDPHELPPLVTGLDLAAVRLVVASLAPDTTTARQAAAGVDGG